LPQMIIWVASAESDAWLSNVIEVKFRISWSSDRNSSEHAYSRANERDSEDKEELADLVSNVKDVAMSP